MRRPVALKNDLKVGTFVLLGLVLAGLVVFMIGDERRVFSTDVVFVTTYDEVQGLKRGAPVQMGGVRVGQVTSVDYSDSADDDKVHVQLTVVKSEAHRIRADSTAHIIPKGLLGDKQIRLTKGTEGEPVKPGGRIKSVEPADMMVRLDDMAKKAETAIVNVGEVAEKLADEDFHRDLRSTMRSLDGVLKKVNDGQGYPNRFFTDPNEAERISHAIETLDESAAELTLTLREIRGAVARVRNGPGFAHDVLYGDGPQKEIAQVGGAAEELALTLRGIREGDGFAHDVLFGGDSDAGDALANVTTLTADLRDIVRGMKQGKGTIGALLVDPSIYEDMKRVLGNVERNSVLRALVRYSIKQDAGQTKVEVSPKAK
ncbi:MAG: MCE family protein [Deltaproteobacteria bacterium]|nr:MCE family protein [Deltaproteobacteria bacterium]